MSSAMLRLRSLASRRTSTQCLGAHARPYGLVSHGPQFLCLAVKGTTMVPYLRAVKTGGETGGHDMETINHQTGRQGPTLAEWLAARKASAA